MKKPIDVKRVKKTAAGWPVRIYYSDGKVIHGAYFASKKLDRWEVCEWQADGVRPWATEHFNLVEEPDGDDPPPAEPRLHVMLDIETMGTGPDAAIVAIGAVTVFDCTVLRPGRPVESPIRQVFPDVEELVSRCGTATGTWDGP